MGLSVGSVEVFRTRFGRFLPGQAGPSRLSAWLGRIAGLRGASAELPFSLLALAPLLLGPAASWASLRDLMLGLLVLILLERAIPRLAAPLPRLESGVDRLLATGLVLVLAAASLLRPGFVVLALLAAACDLARSRYRALPVAAACLALAAAIRVDAGALLLGAGRSLLLPLAVATAVLLVALVRERPQGDPRRSPGTIREAAGVLLDLARLAAFALALSLGLAAATDAGLLGAVPSAWAVLGALALAAGLLTLLLAAQAGLNRDKAAPTGRLGVAMVLAAALMLAVGTRLAAAG